MWINLYHWTTYPLINQYLKSLNRGQGTIGASSCKFSHNLIPTLLESLALVSGYPENKLHALKNSNFLTSIQSYEIGISHWTTHLSGGAKTNFSQCPNGQHANSLHLYQNTHQISVAWSCLWALTNPNSVRQLGLLLAKFTKTIYIPLLIASQLIDSSQKHFIKHIICIIKPQIKIEIENKDKPKTNHWKYHETRCTNKSNKTHK